MQTDEADDNSSDSNNKVRSSSSSRIKVLKADKFPELDIFNKHTDTVWRGAAMRPCVRRSDGSSCTSAGGGGGGVWSFGGC